MMFKQLLFGCMFVCFVYGKHEQFDGHALYKVSVRNEDQARIVNDIERDLLLDVWAHATPTQPGQVLVPKEKTIPFESILKEAAVEFDVVVENIKVQLDLEDELLSKKSGRNNSSRLSFDQIHRFDDVNVYLDELARQYPDLVTVAVAGYSVEGRPIKYLKISTTNFQDTSKPVVMLQSLLHAREWITLPSTLYAIQKLVVDGTDSEMLQNVDWIILPVANPDGYEFSHTDNRLWRKNRRSLSFCAGVDLNRNFPTDWGSFSSNFFCADDYHGSSAMSEPETIAIRDIVYEHRDRMELFLDIHSFGSWILFGYGLGRLPPNALIINLVGVRMAQAIDAVKWSQKPNYVVGNVAMVLYPASGGSMDFAMDAGVPLAYTYELPAFNNNNGFDGFLVDPAFIEQAGFETWEGIKEGANYAVTNFRSRRANVDAKQ